MKIFLLLLLMLSQLSFANDCEQVTDSCAPVGEWKFSLAVGAGFYTNPLHGGDDIPLIIIPQISYYGEKVFFENNTLGYSFFESEQLIISAISQINHEKAYFTPWHPQNVFISTAAVEPSDEEQYPKVNIKDISTRRWAIDAGIQFNWFINQTTDLQVQILHDVNNVYNGLNGQIELTRMLSIEQLPNTLMSFSIGTKINSKNVIDYYYGTSSITDSNTEQYYQGELSVNPYFSMVLTHKLSERWRVKLNLKRVFLDEAMTDSPLVKDDYINTIFAGVSYDF